MNQSTLRCIVAVNILESLYLRFRYILAYIDLDEFRPASVERFKPTQRRIQGHTREHLQ